MWIDLGLGDHKGEPTLGIAYGRISWAQLYRPIEEGRGFRQVIMVKFHHRRVLIGECVVRINMDKLLDDFSLIPWLSEVSQ